MNNQRRKQLNEIRDELRSLEFALTGLRDRLDEVAVEEREAFDNIPESLQTVGREEPALSIEKQLGNLEDIVLQTEDVIEALADVIGEGLIHNTKSKK